MMTNEERADRGFRFFNQTRDMHDDAEDIETSIIDMIADLLHFADQHACDVARVLRCAEMHYTEEKAEEE